MRLEIFGVQGFRSLADVPVPSGSPRSSLVRTTVVRVLLWKPLVSFSVGRSPHGKITVSSGIAKTLRVLLSSACRRGSSHWGLQPVTS